ncbi:MAG: hypothetical protein ACRC6E_10340 [Fusobacteriaceae bacterium]
MKRRAFSISELKFFDGTLTFREIALATNRNVSSIIGFYKKNVDKHNLNVKLFSACSNEIIQLFSEGKKIKEIVVLTGCSYSYVKSFYKGAMYREPNFTEEELEFLLLNYKNLKQTEIAIRLNRPYKTIRNKIHELKKAKDLPSYKKVK